MMALRMPSPAKILSESFAPKMVVNSAPHSSNALTTAAITLIQIPNLGEIVID
jgi:hypothetical protein